jgi:cytochrome d ubiquinol oxidase subunit I
VYGLLRTADSVSPSLTGFDVILSLAGYAVVYLIMFPAGLILMARIVRNGPAESALEEEQVASGRPLHPVEALPYSERRAGS